jgi:hypothetical protein
VKYRIIAGVFLAAGLCWLEAVVALTAGVWFGEIPNGLVFAGFVSAIGILGGSALGALGWYAFTGKRVI